MPADLQIALSLKQGTAWLVLQHGKCHGGMAVLVESHGRPVPWASVTVAGTGAG